MTLKPPAGLGEPGKRLWAGVLDVFDLNAAELAVLGELARLEDVLVDLHEKLLTQDLVVEGSRGQRRANPLLTQIAALAKVQGSLVTALGLPELPGQADQRDQAAQRKKFRRHDGHAA